MAGIITTNNKDVISLNRHENTKRVGAANVFLVGEEMKEPAAQRIYHIEQERNFVNHWRATQNSIDVKFAAYIPELFRFRVSIPRTDARARLGIQLAEMALHPQPTHV